MPSSASLSDDADAGCAQRKRALRAAWRAWRRSVSRGAAARASRALACGTGELFDRLASYRLIAGYVATDGEIDVGPLLARLAALGATICFPRLEDRENRLEFVPVPPARLEHGRWGIPSPSRDVPAVGAHDLDAVMVPGVVFDAAGGRLGRGAGLYDRTFAAAHGLRPILIGTAFASQVVAQLPAERHDRSMDWILTDDGACACTKESRR